jgi:predicted secreted protein
LKPGSILAIYFLFWVASAFLLLPFGVRTDEEVGAERIPGQADSAPHRFDIPRHVLRSTILATVLFLTYYANWYFGWVSADDLDFYH